MDDQADEREYKVIINDEEQYSILLADKTVPAGWKYVGKSGAKAACLAYIDGPTCAR